jgi:polysaccharide biosynthesis transport protein
MPSGKSPDFDIRHYWGMILKRKYLSLGVALTVLSIFTWGSFIWPKTYEAVSTVAVEKSSLIDPLIKGVGVSTNLEGVLGNLKNHITSRNIIERVMKKLDLDANAKNSSQYESTIDGIRNNLNITVMESRSRQADSGTALFTISYTGSNPKTVRDIVNTLVSEYIEENMGHRTSDAEGAYDFIKNQLLEYKTKLDESDKSIREFREKHPRMIPQNEPVLLGKIDGLQTSRMESEIRLKEQLRKKENLQKQLSGEKELTVAYVSRDGTPQGRLDYLNNQLITLQAKYTENYPEVIKVKHEIDDLKRQLAQGKTSKSESSGSETSAMNPIYQQLRQELAKTDSEVDSLRARIGELSRQQGKLDSLLGQMPKEQEEWSKLQRDKNVYQKIYDELVDKLENAKVSKDLEGTNKIGAFRVVDPAILPPLPVKPNRVQMILLGFFFGILSGIGVVLGLENLKPTFKDEGSIESLLKMPVLALIPTINTEEDKILDKKLDRRIMIATASYLAVICLVLTEEFLKRYAGITIINF